MAGSKINNFSIGDSNIQSVMLTLDKTFKGQHQVSLTNYSTTAESQVAAGSVIEIGGALYKFDSNESITGSPSDGTVYIMAVPSGDSVTCAYTNTAPTWSDSKQGWYGTGGTANNRYIGGVTKSGTSWTNKFLLLDKNGLGLLFYKNTFALGFLQNLIFNTLTVEDLQMYGIGYKLLFSWTSVNSSQSATFKILKPMRVAGYVWNNNSLYIYPGFYRFSKGASGSGPHLFELQTKVGTWETITSLNVFVAGQNVDINCIYAEGVNSLDDASRLIEV